MNNINIQKEDKGNMNQRTKLSPSNKRLLVKNYILGVGVTNDTKENILEYIDYVLIKTLENFYIVTPNPEIITFSQMNKEYQKVLNQGQIALCDGIGILIAGQFLGRPFKQRITGVDFMKDLCARYSDRPITVGFLGGGPGVAIKSSECLKAEFPLLKVKYAVDEWSENEMKTPVDILFVAFGFPKQEIWMSMHINKVPVRMMIGVGGAFDYYSGNVIRAPGRIRAIGGEWLFRLITQPWRWKRQLALVKFIGLIVRERVKR